MRQYWLGVGLLALTPSAPAAGATAPTPSPRTPSSPDYGKKAGDKMKEMYGVPKAEKASTEEPGGHDEEMYGE